MKSRKIFAIIILITLIMNTLSGIVYGISDINNIKENREENINKIENEVKDEKNNEIENNIANDINSSENSNITEDTNTNNNNNTTDNENEIKDNTIDKEGNNEIKNEIDKKDEEEENKEETKEDNENKIEEDIVEEVEEKEEVEEEQNKMYSNVKNVTGVIYRTHVEEIGWQNYVKNEETAGTEGRCLRLEALDIKLQNLEGIKIKYKVHVESIGWQDWKTNGEMAGTEGKALRLEAMRIQLEATEEYSIMYRVHVQDIGWQDWRTDGEIAGTEGKALRLEAMQIKIIPKIKKGTMNIDSPSSGTTYYSPESVKVSGWKMSNVANTKIKVYLDEQSTPLDEKFITYRKRNDVIESIIGYGTAVENPNAGFAVDIDTSKMSNGRHTIRIQLCTPKSEVIKEESIIIIIDRDLHVQYRSHVQEIGWQGYVKDGSTSGTEGRNYRIEALNINLINAPSNAKILYKTHVEQIGWQNWVSNDEIAGTEGKALRIEAIQIKLENLNDYTVEYQVHIQDKGWSDWYIDGETAGTVAQAKRIEAIRIKIVPKYKREYHGIDVSQFNGNINWGFVKRTGIDFAFIRVGFRGYGQAGNFREDSTFRANIEAAKKAGIPVGVYFVTQAITTQEAIEEANWVIERIKAYNIEYPVAIDIEAPGLESPTDVPRTQHLDKGTRTYLAKIFCQTIQGAGYTPIIYTNVDWATNKLNMSDLSEYDTWIASYRSGNPGYNGKYSIWQYTSGGTVNGILGRVDMNICYKKY